MIPILQPETKTMGGWHAFPLNVKMGISMKLNINADVTRLLVLLTFLISYFLGFGESIFIGIPC